MKIKTSELTGAALDWAVAKCEGALEKPLDIGSFLDGVVPHWSVVLPHYNPSTDWAQGGPIIERQEIGTRVNRPCSAGREWEASPSITAKGAGGRWGYGPHPLIAAMRCYVASKMGDEVEVPDELLES